MDDKRSHISRAIKLISQLSIDISSQVFSKLLKSGARIDLENIYVTDISDATEKVMHYGNEVVGAFVDLIGDAPLKFLFFVDAKDSLILTDLMLRREVGIAKKFDILASSAVQEIGNILASAISNVFVKDFQMVMKPMAPIVVHDYAATIFQEYIMAAASDKNDIMILESSFCVVKYNIKCRMFILPVGNSEQVLHDIASALEKKE